MAVTVITTRMAAAINYTHVTDSSADWGLVPVSTYFYDKADKLVHYKDSTGAILEIFTSSTGGTTTSAGSLILDVKINQTGGILKGQAVYVNGADGTNIEIGKADFSTEATSSKTLGLLISSGADNDQRQVITEGDLKGTGTEPLDTSAGAQGDPIWLGDDGNLIYGLINKPYAPDHLVFIGVVVQSHPVVGEIYVKVQNGFELDELHDVDLISNPPTNGQVLTYNGSTGLWEASSIPPAASGGTQLLTGGASWSGTGMIFDVTALTYQIDGNNYSSVATTVTLPAGDALNPRFDAIVVDEFGVVSFISGIPSANPVTPTIPGDQVLVQYILVNAGAVVPNITDEWVYRESQSGDWVGSIIGSAPAPTAVWNSPTPAPFAGTACLLASYSAYSTGRYIRFQAPAPISRSTYVGLSLRVYLPQNFATLDGGLGRRPFVQLRGGASLTSFGVRYLDQHGLNPTLVGVWQQVTIPTALFGSNAGITDIRVVDLFLIKSSSVANTYVDIAYDNIVFQSGFGTTSALPTIDILDNGTVTGSTSKLNFIDGANTTAVVTQDVPNNKIDVKFDTPNITLSSAAGTSLVNDGTGPALALKGLLGGSGITLSTNLANTLVTITNVAPDQIVALTSGTGINVTGTYPNFTIDNTVSDTNIYNSDGTLTATRIVSLNANELQFQDITANGQVVIIMDDGTTKIGDYRFSAVAGSLEVGDNAGNSGSVFIDKNQSKLQVNAGATTRKIEVTPTGVNVNGEYILPNADGSAFQALTTDGAGNLYWSEAITPSSAFMPPVEQSEIRRGSIAISGTTGTANFGGITPALTGSAVAVSFGGTVPLPKLRLLTTVAATNSTVGIITGAANAVYRVGKGFRFIGSYIYSDQSSGGTNWYSIGARQFCGLATGLSLLNISSTVTVQSKTNIIGIGSDAADTNLQIFHNGTGTATKIDLGSNFPANKTGAVTNSEVYQLELYNAFGSTDVKYRVRKLSTGIEVIGTITTNLPNAVDLGPQIVRTSGSSSENVSIDLVQLTAYTRE